MVQCSGPSNDSVHHNNSGLGDSVSPSFSSIEGLFGKVFSVFYFWLLLELKCYSFRMPSFKTLQPEKNSKSCKIVGIGFISMKALESIH